MVFDQAMGLRQMLGARAPRVFSFVASEAEAGTASMLFNLAGSLQRSGSRVLIVDAFDNPNSVSALVGVSQKRTISDGIRLNKDLRDAIDTAGGVQVATLRRNTWGGGPVPMPSQVEKSLLESALSKLAEDSDIVLVDARIGADGFPCVGGAETAQIVVPMSANADALKKGYALVKSMVAAMGARRFGVILSGADEQAGAKIFENLARAAKQYLGTDLIAFGAIPKDPFVAQADSVRRPVVEAFPEAQAAAAFRRIAGQVAQIEMAV